MLYEGKAKKVYSVDAEPSLVLIEFKDSLTAFNAQKKGEFSGKGRLNRDIAASIFGFLHKQGIPTHFVRVDGERSILARRVQIIPLEVVVRNVMAGSTAKKLGLPEGRPLKAPLVEFYLKNDALQDPFVSEDQILVLEIADQKTLEKLKNLALRVNTELKHFFAELDLDLVDFKIELGRDSEGNIILADEISPDSCRLWDRKTGERLDKDRFRRDLGGVREAYQQVWQRIQNKWEGK
ncbi:MAG: phosphoribosylaminoimidazolesuccinocarboxamide synthase [Bdellovibrionaceae bacterium]|nr:phosphoribosylaminoimidazolesuccinocarboxamide synthase [Pseudobdellovibrionaceae bacterium]